MVAGLFDKKQVLWKYMGFGFWLLFFERPAEQPNEDIKEKVTVEDKQEANIVKAKIVETEQVVELNEIVGTADLESTIAKFLEISSKLKIQTLQTFLKNSPERHNEERAELESEPGDELEELKLEDKTETNVDKTEQAMEFEETTYNIELRLGFSAFRFSWRWSYISEQPNTDMKQEL